MDKAEPNSDLIDNIWHGDYLNRRQDANFLRTFLVNRVAERKKRGETASFVLNLDARWGQGKTFFLDRFKQQLEQEGFIVAKVNAWRDDHTDDPLIAVMAAVDEALKPFLTGKKSKSVYKLVKENAGAVALAAGKGFAKTLIQKYVGSSVEDLISGISTEDDSTIEKSVSAAVNSGAKEIESISGKITDQFIKSFNEESSAIESFKKNITSIIASVSEENGKADLLFILIDELDRCRPTYAIKLLERVKHMFETDQVVFVVATDTQQLKHSIRATYGGEFDAQTYLQRFFDRTFRFNKVGLNELAASYYWLLSNSKLISPHDQPVSVVTTGIQLYELTLRQLKQTMELIENLTTIWTDPAKLDLVTVFALCAMFAKESRCSFGGQPALNHSWLSDFTFFDGTVSESGPNKRQFNYTRVYSNIFDSINGNINNLKSNGSSDPEDLYLEQIFQNQFQSQPDRKSKFGKSPFIHLPEMIESLRQIS